MPHSSLGWSMRESPSLPGDHNISLGRCVRGPPLRRGRGGEIHSIPLDRALRAPPR